MRPVLDLEHRLIRDIADLTLALRRTEMERDTLAAERDALLDEMERAASARPPDRPNDGGPGPPPSWS